MSVELNASTGNPQIDTRFSFARSRNPCIVSLYEHFVHLVEACGKFEYVLGKYGIAFKGQRRNFAVAKPKARSLKLIRSVRDGIF